MANASFEVQVFIDEQHRRCARALQEIAALADTGSDFHKKRFPKGTPSGWRLVDAMAEIAIDVVGYSRKDVEQ
jgi:hypothetical protein